MKNRNRMIVNCVTASLMYYWSLPALAEQSSSEIKIVRDEYGMPHIYANDTWHLDWPPESPDNQYHLNK